MSDIAEKLRDYANDDHERLCQGRAYSCSCGYDDKRDPLMTEAADEITALRAENERLRAALEAWNNAVRVHVMMEKPVFIGVSPTLGRLAWEKARAALEGK